MYRRNALYGYESAREHSVEMGLRFFSVNYEQKPIEKGINMQDGMLSDVFLWLPLRNIIADKHIPYVCVYFFSAKGNKMFILSPTLLSAASSDVAVGKGRGLLWAVLNHGGIRTSCTPEDTLTH